MCVCASIAKVSHCVKLLLLLLPPLLLLMPTERLVSWLWAVIIVITAKYQLFFFPLCLDISHFFAERAFQLT